MQNRKGTLLKNTASYLRKLDHEIQRWVNHLLDQIEQEN